MPREPRTAHRTCLSPKFISQVLCATGFTKIIRRHKLRNQRTQMPHSAHLRARYRTEMQFRDSQGERDDVYDVYGVACNWILSRKSMRDETIDETMRHECDAGAALMIETR